MQKLMPDRISQVEEKSLSAEDINILKTKRDKQLRFLLPVYLAFICIGLYLFAAGPESMNTGKDGIWRTEINIDDEKTERFWRVVPYFVGFMFLMLNIYFGKLYFQTLRPIIKDIKTNRKQLLFFKPTKNPMAYFNKYYISTPLYQNQQVQISREDFDGIMETDHLCLEVGPESTVILRLLNGKKEIKYY